MATEHHGEGIHNSGNAPLEKDFSNGYHLDSNHDADDALRKIRTTGSLSISPELFEKIYLSPQNKVAGELRKTVGNPTPVALVGFLLSLTPLSCMLMGWRGSSSGAANIGAYFGFGGILMILGSIGEWILGNTFPSVVFGSFGAFWVAFGILLTPASGAISDYSGSTPQTLATGITTLSFNSSLAFYLVFMGVLTLVYSICALRTNLILFLILFSLPPAFGCLAGTYFYAAKAYDPATSKTDAAAFAKKSKNLEIACGAITFWVDMLGWYIFTAILLAAVDFPFSIPVFDLSHIIKGASEKTTARDGEV